MRSMIPLRLLSVWVPVLLATGCVDGGTATTGADDDDDSQFAIDTVGDDAGGTTGTTGITGSATTTGEGDTTTDDTMTGTDGTGTTSDGAMTDSGSGDDGLDDSGSTDTDTGDGTDTELRRVVFTTQPTRSITGSPVAPGPQVAIKNTEGKVLNIPYSVAVVSFGKNAGCDAGACGDMSGNLTVRFENGYATLDQLYINRCGIGYQLKVDVSDIGSVVSDPFDVLAPGEHSCAGIESTDDTGDTTDTGDTGDETTGGDTAFEHDTVCAILPHCRVNEDCGDAGQYCDLSAFDWPTVRCGLCETRCTADADCGGSTPLCNTVGGNCVALTPCTTDTACAATEMCHLGACIPLPPCSDGQFCTPFGGAITCSNTTAWSSVGGPALNYLLSWYTSQFNVLSTQSNASVGSASCSAGGFATFIQAGFVCDAGDNLCHPIVDVAATAPASDWLEVFPGRYITSCSQLDTPPGGATCTSRALTCSSLGFSDTVDYCYVP